jgi:hypothetical protein
MLCPVQLLLLWAELRGYAIVKRKGLGLGFWPLCFCTININLFNTGVRNIVIVNRLYYGVFCGKWQAVDFESYGVKLNKIRLIIKSLVISRIY